ncbi:MAG: glycosyltransferase family 4 protein [Alphaproteobacteria bacterium]
MSVDPLRILCLDVEGGYGGSSRSLYESLRHLNASEATAEVWCRRDGPIQPRYQAIGIATRVMPAMPRFSALPRLSRNLHAAVTAILEFRRAGAFLEELRRETARFDVIHFNHEALFPIAHWLRQRSRRPMTMHIRTNLIDSMFARFQTRIIANAVDHLVFITENEAEAFRRLGGHPRAASVIYNIVDVPAEPPAPHPAVPADGRFKIACLSSYSYARGLDRLVDVADALARHGRQVLFVMAGRMALTGSMPGLLGEIGRRRGGLEEFVAARGRSGMFQFLGHVSDPESVLAGCDALVKPTRENNPWGRDTLEALALGKPVLTCGRYDKFVEDGVTGILQPEFDTSLLAGAIMHLDDDRSLVRRMGDAGRGRVRELCDGNARAADLLAVWRRVRKAA